jgi:hypothetical protein
MISAGASAKRKKRPTPNIQCRTQRAPADLTALLVSPEERGGVCGWDAEFLQGFGVKRAAVMSSGRPAGCGAMKHDGEVALVLVSRAKGPVVRDRDVQDLAKFRCDDFADLFCVFAIAKIGGHGRETQPAKSEDDTQSD